MGQQMNQMNFVSRVCHIKGAQLLKTLPSEKSWKHTIVSYIDCHTVRPFIAESDITYYEFIIKA